MCEKERERRRGKNRERERERERESVCRESSVKEFYSLVTFSKKKKQLELDV